MIKKLTFLILLFFSGLLLQAQHCIDLIILKGDAQENRVSDTLFCKIMTEDETDYIIDNGFAITSIAKKMVKEVKECFRPMTNYEIYKFKGIDNVTMDYFQNAQTAGNYFRKAAFNMYLSTGLVLVGGTGIILGVTTFKNTPSQNYWIAAGGIFAATALVFSIVGWNQIYKAGKLMDINNKTSLYLNATPEGELGLKLKF